MESWNPATAQTWVELLTQRAQLHPNKIAIRFLANGEDETEVLTYLDLHCKAQAIGANLSKLADPGERAIILLPNDVSFITTFFGCLYARLIAVPGYPPRANRNQDRITKMLKQCSARLIIGDSNLNKQEILGNLAAMNFRNVRYMDLSTQTLDLETTWRSTGVVGSDTAFLQYTSGSTSDPKGVVLTHKNLLSNEVMIQKAFAIHSESSYVSWLPLYHDMGLIGNLMAALFVGCEITLMPPAVFIQKPSRWLNAASKYKATVTGAPNFAYDLCVRRFKAEEMANLDLSSVQVMFSGAEPVRSASLEAFAHIFEKYKFDKKSYFPCYGLAEGSVFVSGGPARTGEINVQISREHLQRDEIFQTKDGDITVLVASGEIAEGLDVQIVNPQTLQPVANNQVGEIMVAGESVSSGYWDNEEQNKQIFGLKIPGMGDRDYLRTGDLGYMKERKLFITGRIKDVIIIEGKNHYPQDLEASAQAACKTVSIAAAFTLEGQSSEKLVVVAEVGRTQMNTDFNQAAQEISERIGSHHELIVSRIVFVKPGVLPRTSSGKIQRRLTRQKLVEGSLELLASWGETGMSSEIVPQKTAKSPQPPQVESHAVAIKPPSMTAVVSTIQPAAAPMASQDHLLEEIKAFVTAKVIELRPVAKGQIGDDVMFTALGIDSLAGAELMFALKKKFSVSLPDTLAWDYPTVAKTSGLICKMLKKNQNVS